MKRIVFYLGLLLLLLPLCAQAEPARDVTAQARIEINGLEARGTAAWDRDESTGVAAPEGVAQFVWITPGADAVAAVYVEFGAQASSIRMDSYDGENWYRQVAWYNPGYSQATITFPPQQKEFRLEFFPARAGERMYIRELYLFTEGELDPGLAHSWQSAPEKADILFVATHPDDELLWFGGAIPACVEAGKSVQVVYLTCENPTRRLELLNGLWRCGVRGYPEILYLKDEKAAARRQVLEDWNEKALLVRLTRLLRAYRPEVVVTHGLDGEYGHIQHILCAELMQKAVRLAAEADFDSRSGEAWQVKKLYLHGGEQPTLRMDWDVPLTSFDGKTGIELAREAFLYHVSQQNRRHRVAAAGEEYDSTLYTLISTTVGEDEEKNDFFEHISPKDEKKAEEMEAELP